MRFTALLLCLAGLAAAGSAQEKGDAANGRYIAERVAMCIQCHTPRDANGALLPEKKFEGGAVPVEKPRQFRAWAEFAPRIAGLPQYSEEQLIVLLTTGTGREGKPLRAPMPTFGMTRQHAADIAAYLTSLK